MRCWDMPMPNASYDISRYGLDDKDVLADAVSAAPHLFVALSITTSSRHDLPIRSVADLAAALDRAVRNDAAFTFNVDDVLEDFPKEFLPISDRQELLSKVYAALLASRTRQERARREAYRSSP